MGYCMSQVKDKFTMTRENVAKALEKAREMTRDEKFLCEFGLGSGNAPDTGSLEEFMDCLCWEIRTEDGAVTGIDFVGEKRGWGEDELFELLAPFVEEDSYIEMRGEDGDAWRWVFKRGKVFTVEPTVTWPDP